MLLFGKIIVSHRTVPHSTLRRERVRNSIPLESLVSKETMVPCQRGSESQKFVIKQAHKGEISTIKR